MRLISPRVVGTFIAAIWLLTLDCGALSQVITEKSASTEGASVFPLVPAVPDKFDATDKAQVFQYDSSALGNRVPLMLIHGGGGESRPYFRMDGIAKWLQHDPRFQDKYKIYFLRYNGSAVLDQSVPKLKDALIDFHDK